MRQVAIFLSLTVASMAGKFLTSAIDTLSRTTLTGIAITMFSGFFIFTVMTAKSPVQFQWKPQVRISPVVKEHLSNAMKLAGTLLMIAAIAVVLVAAAGTGPGQSFPNSVMNVLKSLPKLLDV